MPGAVAPRAGVTHIRLRLPQEVRMKILPVLAAAIALAACSTAKPPLDEMQRTALADSIEQWVAGPYLAAHQTPNVDTILALYAGGADLAVAANGTIYPSYDSVVAAARAFWGRPGVTAQLTLGGARVNVLSRDAAVVTAKVTGAVRDSAGVETPMGVAWTAVLQRAGSGWKIVAEHASSPPPAPVAEPARPAVRRR
jgi:ketosteroid isomerase-like protein